MIWLFWARKVEYLRAVLFIVATEQKTYMVDFLFTFIKYMRTNSHRTVVMPSRAKPFPTLRTVFLRENFLASPSTVIMNFIP